MALYRYTWKAFSRELILLCSAALFCIPFYLVVIISLKSTAGAYASPFSIPTEPTLASYSGVWSSSGTGVGMGRALLNSVIITFGSLTCLLGLGSLAAYTLARRPSRLSTALYFLFVLGIIVPGQLALIPLYVALRDLHLVGTYIGMILLWTGLLMPLTVFLYTGFIRALPPDYEEAARVDGAGLFRTYVMIVFPLLRPITGTAAFILGIDIWNDFFVPVIFLSGSKNATFPLAIYSYAGEYLTQWNALFAAVVIAIAPALTFYIVAQRRVIRGFAGGLKG
jgi:raffinose/stachyose/melibiose transport system permease protein